MTSTMPLDQLLQDQARLQAVAQYLPVVADAYARSARIAARAAATPFALEIRQAKQKLSGDLRIFLSEQFWQTNQPVQLETLNKLFSSKSGWQKHFFAFQASVPLRGADGHIIGALIVLDEQIRELDAHGVVMLEDIAEALITELDLRQQLEHKSEAEQVVFPEMPVQTYLPELVQTYLPEPVPTPEIEFVRSPEMVLADYFKPATLLEQSATAMIAETLDGTIIYANLAMNSLLGYSSLELIGQNTSQLLSDYQVELAPDLLELLYGGLTLDPILGKRRHKNGLEIGLHISYAPVFDDQGLVIGVSSNYIPVIKTPLLEISVLPVLKTPVPVQETPAPDFISQLPAVVFSVNIEGQITACAGSSLPLFENPEALVGQLIFKVFQPYNALLEAVCFALLGEEHESTIQLGTQSVRLHLHPIHRVGQPSDVIGIAIPVA
jgi:PAS domain S-box-containing protein